MPTELEQLQAAYAELGRKIEALLAKEEKPAAPKGYVEPFTQVFAPVATSPLIVPTSDELERLYKIALADEPRLAECGNLVFRGSKEDNEAEHFRQFCTAFVDLGKLRRTDKPDAKHHWSHWKDESRCSSLSFTAWAAAVLAHGDIPHRGLFEDARTFEIGLTYPYNAGKPAGDAWRQVIRDGKPRAPSRHDVPMAPRSPARVVTFY